LKYSNLDFKAHKEKSTGKVYVNIGGLSIKENLNEIDSLLFKYYPKRRRIMKQRMLNTPTTQFLLGKQSKTSAWILKRFRKKGILNEQNKLTAKGKKVRKSLQDLEKEIIPSPLPTLRQNIF
jgi:patatin-like phospholipase/acyl hydrolase